MTAVTTKHVQVNTVRSLVNAIEQLISHDTAMILKKDNRDVIATIITSCEERVLIKEVQRLARNVLFFPSGRRYTLREETLLKSYQYEVVCLENDGTSWLTLGIKTPIGIILYEP